MKIAQVISTPPFAWATGGPARNVYEISKALVKRNHHVTLLTTDLYSPNRRYEIKKNPEYIAGIEIYRFKVISNWLAWKYKIYIAPSIIFYLRKHLKEYDIVHLQDFLSVQAAVTSKYCKKNKIPYVLQTRGSLQTIIEKQKLKKLYALVCGNRILKYASKVIALNEAEKAQYRAMGVDDDRIEIVPNGIDLTEYENLPQKGDFRKKYSIREDEKVILYLGRIHKIKGINLLVSAFADIIKELDSVRLVLVGPDDGFLSTLKRQIKKLKLSDKIVFTGPLYETDRLEAYVDADVYVLPSVYEIFGVTVLEACACGTPVIVTDRCGIADFVSKVGCVVEYDKSKLRDAIIKILSDESVRIRFEAESRKLLRDVFGWDRIIPEIEKIYSNSMVE